MNKGFTQKLIDQAVRLLFRVTEGKWPEQRMDDFEVHFNPDGTYQAKLKIVQQEQAQIAQLAASFFRKAESVNQVTFQYLDAVDCEVYEVCIQKLSRPGLGKVNFALRTALEAIAQGSSEPDSLAKQALDACGYNGFVFTRKEESR